MMKNCKRIFLVGACSLFMISFTHQAQAAARSNAGFDYLARNPSLEHFTVGFYGGRAQREIEQAGTIMDNTLKSTRVYGYFGVDITRWINLYGILGANQAELDNTPTADTELMYGAGLSLNLLNHFIREPTTIEDAIRINGDLRVIATEADFPRNSVSWQEWTASLRVSLVNFPRGDKRYRPEAIALYGGPAFSYIQSSDIEAKREFGAIGGLEIFIYDSLSLDFNFEYYDKASVFGGLNIRF